MFGHGVTFCDVTVLEDRWSDHLPVAATITPIERDPALQGVWRWSIRAASATVPDSDG